MKQLVSISLLCIALSGYAKTEEFPAPSAPDGEVAGHEYVDLGLPSGTLWATCNLGADAPYINGEHFAWGEIQSRSIFNQRNYKFFEREEDSENGVHTFYFHEIGDNISCSEYDAARTMWGDNWRMPTQEECEELLAYCRTDFREEKTPYRTSGLRIWGPNDNSIFLPVSFCPGNGFTQAVLSGQYWSGTLSADNENDSKAFALYFVNSELKYANLSRHEGLSIRPVISRNDISTSVNTLTQYAPAMKYENGIVTLNGYTDRCMLTVSDLSGRQIYSSTVADSKCQLNHLPKGIYLISLSKDTRHIKTIKITVK